MDVVLTLDANDSLNTITWHESFDTNGKSTTDMGWVRKSHTFQATSTRTALAFVSTTSAPDEGGDGKHSRCGPALDDVRVVLVPEASSMLLLLPGLLPLGLMLRRRAKA
jgi:hypothetical protein